VQILIMVESLDGVPRTTARSGILAQGGDWPVWGAWCTVFPAHTSARATAAMNPATQEILAYLDTVAGERAQRRAEPVLSRRVDGLKHYQQGRFAQTYADLLANPRYRTAARFFLDELYGPSDFTLRDAQFARVVPKLVQMLPHEVVQTVTVLSALHALTEGLDTEMARHGLSDEWTPAAYQRAWQQTGRPGDRERQIAWTLQLAARLDELTRNKLLRTTLRVMRTPARLSGLQDLQRFLEAGFDAFGGMGGANDFIGLIEARELAFMKAQFAGA
jgi:hypothetical protein